MLGALIWWFVSARKWFKGPKVNIEHAMLGREGTVLTGEESGGSSANSFSKEARDAKAADLA